MRLKLTYESVEGQKIMLPVHYNHIIQALIYTTFSPLLAEEIHDEGFKFGKRSFKMFTFSRVLEKGLRLNTKLLDTFVKNGDSKYLSFKTLTFYFSSPFDEIVTDLGGESLKKLEFNLLGQKISLSRLEIVVTPTFTEKMLIRMLSPVTIHSTLLKEDGKKMHYYFKPVEKDFSTLIEENAKKKFVLINKRLPDRMALTIKPYKFSVKQNLCIILFKGTPVEAYTGIYELSGSRELIAATYEAGLGDRSPEGFGMWEIWKGGK